MARTSHRPLSQREAGTKMPQRERPAPAPPPPGGGPNRTRTAVVVFLLSLAVLCANAALYYPVFFDDAFISLRYVDRFVHGQGLTWTNGERVEGYSNLLWILLLSVPGALGIDLVASARVLGMVASMGVVAAFCTAYVRRDIRSGRVLAFGTLVWSLAGPAGVWSRGGLEQPLVACLIAWVLVLLLH